MAFTIGNALALPLIKMVIGKEGDVWSRVSNKGKFIEVELLEDDNEEVEQNQRHQIQDLCQKDVVVICMEQLRVLNWKKIWHYKDDVEELLEGNQPPPYCSFSIH
jgi:hypothetical protein